MINPNCDLKLEEGDVIYLIRPSPIRTQKTFITRGNSIRMQHNKYVSKTNRKNRREQGRRSNSSINLNHGDSQLAVSEDSVTLQIDKQSSNLSGSASQRHLCISDDAEANPVSISVPTLSPNSNSGSGTQTYYSIRSNNQSVECTKLDVTSHLPQVTVI